MKNINRVIVTTFFLFLALVSLSYLLFDSVAKDLYLVKPKVVSLDPALFPRSYQGGFMHAYDITKLNLEQYSDAASTTPSPVELLEDGRPLSPHTYHDTIQNRCHGCFSHWGNTIYFSPTDDDPNKHTYTAIYSSLPNNVGALVRAEYLTFWIPIALLFAASVVFLLTVYRRQTAWTFSAGLLAAALVSGYGLSQFFYEDRTLGGSRIEWNSLSVAPDSLGYTDPDQRPGMRSPMYPWFLRAFTARNPEGFALDLKAPMGVASTPTYQSPLLAAVRMQKILLCVGLGLLVLALTPIVSAPVAAGLGILIIDFEFLVFESGFVLTEALAQAIGFVCVALFIQVIRHRVRIGLASTYLIALAVACGVLYQTRPAGLYSFVLCAVGGLSVLANVGFRRAIPLAIGTLGVLLLGVLYAGIARVVSGSDFRLTSLPMSSMGRIAFAMEVVDQSDLDAATDPLIRQFLTLALVKKAEFAARRQDTPEMPDQNWFNGNISEIAIPSVKSLPLPDGDPQFEMYLTVANYVMKRHTVDYLKLVAKQFNFALTAASRVKLDPHLSLWRILGLLLLSLCIIPGTYRWVTIGCVGTHLAHLFIVSAHNAPITRYVFATEFLLVIAIAVTVAGAFVSVAEFVIRRQRAGSDAPVTFPGTAITT